MCKKCVLKHNGHAFFLIRDRCNELAKPWSDLNNRLTRIKAALDELPVAEEDKAKAEQRHQQFKRKYEGVIAKKKDHDFEGLALEAEDVSKYTNKVVEFINAIVKASKPKKDKKHSQLDALKDYKRLAEEYKKEAEEKI